MSNASEQPNDARPEPEDSKPAQDDLSKVFAPPSETGPTPQEPPAASYGPQPGAAPGNPYAPPFGGAPGNPYSWPQAGQPGWAGYPGYPGGQQQKEWSGYAITSLVTGIFGGLCFLWAVGIGFGIAALRTMPRRNQRGRGMAIAGIVLSGIWLVLNIVFVVIMIIAAGHAERGPRSGGFVPGLPHGTQAVSDLQPGDCFDKLSDGKRVLIMPCDEAHEGEAFAVVPLNFSSFPGEQRIVEESQRSCAAKVSGYLEGVPLPDSVQVRFFHPTEASWSNSAARVTTCMFVGKAGKTTGSVLDGGSSASPSAVPRV